MSLCKVQLRETLRAITNAHGTIGGTGEHVRGDKKCVKDAGRPSEWAHEVLCAKSRSPREMRWVIWASQRNDGVKTTLRWR